jgi:hypothetical protein
LDRAQPTKPIAGAIGEESKPEPGAKRPPKTAQARIPKCADIADRHGIESTADSIEEWPVW